MCIEAEGPVAFAVERQAPCRDLACAQEHTHTHTPIHTHTNTQAIPILNDALAALDTIKEADIA